MIEVKNLYKTYRMGQIDVQALRHISLKISAGEFIAIMGASGSGKSTLMHVLGLLDRPESGQYFFDGKEVSHLTDQERAVLRNRLVGFVFQQFHLLPRMTALENVELPLIYAGKVHLKKEAQQRLERVGLADRLLHRPNELSGGQQQRVAIARALVNDPLLLLADEPTGNLDSKSKEEILEILKTLNKEGKTVVVVTHEAEVAAHAKRVIMMRDGQIISDKTQGQKNDSARSGSSMKNEDILVSKTKNAWRGMEFWDYLRQAVLAMLAHKMRALLSILGILIGVAAVIAMLAVGRGAQDSIQKQLASLGSNLLMVMPGSARLHGIGMQQGAVTRFNFRDVEAIAKMTELVEDVSPAVNGRVQIVYGGNNCNTQLEGVSPAYEKLRSATPAEGRFFTAEEVQNRSKVALLGTTVVKQLFGETNPLGQTIKINLINFKVIGILPARGGGGWRDQDDVVVVPVTTAMYRLLGKSFIDIIYVGARGPEFIDSAQEEVKQLIAKGHRMSAKEAEDNFNVRNMSDIKKAMESSTKTMGLLLGAIAAISLLVGGIGIMNIMLVSVTERTREIGLRKALGANNHDIMTQFLIESVLMSLIGGILGTMLGSGISVLITLVAGWSVKISVFSIILATVFSLFVGLVFGLWPARQASRLNPIEALRYE